MALVGVPSLASQRLVLFSRRAPGRWVTGGRKTDPRCEVVQTALCVKLLLPAAARGRCRQVWPVVALGGRIVR